MFTLTVFAALVPNVKVALEKTFEMTVFEVTLEEYRWNVTGALSVP